MCAEFLHAQADSNNSAMGIQWFSPNTVDEARRIGRIQWFILDTTAMTVRPSRDMEIRPVLPGYRAGGDTGSTIDPEEMRASDSGAHLILRWKCHSTGHHFRFADSEDSPIPMTQVLRDTGLEIRRICSRYRR